MTEPKIARKTPAKAAKPAVAGKRAPAGAKKTPVDQAPAMPAQPAASAKAKHKLIRDSFTIPKLEYAVLDGLKLRAIDLKRPTKKSELLRAGIAALNAMNDKAFLSALSGIASLKTGRPKGVRASDK